MTVFATPVALVMRMREAAYSSFGSVLYQKRHQSQRCQLVDIMCFSYLGLSSTCLNRKGDEVVSHSIASEIPVIVFRICAHFGGVTRCGSASLG